MMGRFRTVIATGLIAASTLAVGAQPVAAGCGITVRYENRDGKEVKVDLAKSKSRIKSGLGIFGTYKKLGTGKVTIPANGRKTKTYTLDFSCNTWRSYKFFVTKGGNSMWIYIPQTVGDATKDTTLTVTIDF